MKKRREAILDDFSCNVVVWKLCTIMKVHDVTDTFNLAPVDVYSGRGQAILKNGKELSRRQSNRAACNINHKQLKSQTLMSRRTTNISAKSFENRKDLLKCRMWRFLVRGEDRRQAIMYRLVARRAIDIGALSGRFI